MNETADVVIIGGGVIGLSIAYNLAKQGCTDVILLEKSYLASGSTGRCGAGVRMQWGTEMNCRLAKASIESYETLEEELGYQRSIEFKQGGYLLLSHREETSRQFKKNIKLQNSLDIPSRFLTPKEAKEIVPHLDIRTLDGAAFCPRDGHCNPFYVTDAYAQAAARLGVSIRKFTEATGIITFGGRVAGVQTKGGLIETGVVVNAAGPKSQHVAAMAGIELPVYSERHQILVTEPVEPLQDPMVMCFEHSLYVQQTPHGSFIIGQGDPNEPKNGDIMSSYQFLEAVCRKVAAILPPLGELRIVRQWAGEYNITPDAQPILGATPKLEGFYLAVGFSGHGFMLAPITGRLIAEMILEKPTSVDVRRLRLERFETGELVQEPAVV